MNTFVQQINKVVSALRQHFAATNLDSTEKVTLTPEQTIVYNKELTNQKTFLDFHINIGTGTVELDHTCHCAAAQNVKDMLTKHKVSFTETSFHCDCGSEFLLPVPKAQHFQVD